MSESIVILKILYNKLNFYIIKIFNLICLFIYELLYVLLIIDLYKKIKSLFKSLFLKNLSDFSYYKNDIINYQFRYLLLGNRLNRRYSKFKVREHYLMYNYAYLISDYDFYYLRDQEFLNLLERIYREPLGFMHLFDEWFLHENQSEYCDEEYEVVNAYDWINPQDILDRLDDDDKDLNTHNFEKDFYKGRHHFPLSFTNFTKIYEYYSFINIYFDLFLLSLTIIFMFYLFYYLEWTRPEIMWQYYPEVFQDKTGKWHRNVYMEHGEKWFNILFEDIVKGLTYFFYTLIFRFLYLHYITDPLKEYCRIRWNSSKADRKYLRELSVYERKRRMAIRARRAFFYREKKFEDIYWHPETEIEEFNEGIETEKLKEIERQKMKEEEYRLREEQLEKEREARRKYQEILKQEKLEGKVYENDPELEDARQRGVFPLFVKLAIRGLKKDLKVVYEQERLKQQQKDKIIKLKQQEKEEKKRSKDQDRLNKLNKLKSDERKFFK